MMDILNSNKYFNEYKPNPIDNNNLSFNMPKYDKSFNNSIQRENNKTAYTTNNNINQNNNYSTFERYQNQQLLNRAGRISCNCSCHTNPNINQKCHFCNLHNFHIHHIHISRDHLHNILGFENLSEIQKLNSSVNNSNNLLKEVTELRNECKKFKEELERNNNEKDAGDKYIRKLENEINSNSIKNDEKKENNQNFNIYHDMLDKSFKIINSVSDKCNDEKAKAKGGVYYYMNKDPEYDELIQAQKNWIDNLQENKIPANLNMNQIPLNQNENNINKYNNENNNNNSIKNNPYKNNVNSQIRGINENNNQSKYCFDAKRNNNKGYIIKKGDKKNNNKKNDLNNNNPNEMINLDKDLYNNNPSNSNNEEVEEKENENKEEINADINNDLNSNKNQENKIENNNEEDEANPFYERYLLIDENGNPILKGGERLLGMELIPLIGEDGKEIIDENGNIILIGPDKQPKSQEELEPILLDDDQPLVNEENKPFLGLCGVPLINEEGSPIIGPGELYDKDNNIVKGVLGTVAKDNMGNPIKITINEIDNDNDNNDQNKLENNKINNDINHDINNGNNNQNNSEQNNVDKNAKNFSKLKPLIGADGIPMKDSNNNHIILDENNIPVQDTGISVLLNESGKPIFNSLGEPILLDQEGNTLNSDNNIQNQNQKISLNNKQFLNYNKIPPKEKMIQKRNNMKNRRRMRKNEKGKLNYSECNQKSLKKINFMRPNQNPFYDDNEYKVNCFACDVGCSVSKSGYSCMNYSPYNNLIRRRDITPIRKNNGKNKKNKNSNININKIGLENDNNYYLTEK